jgi:hypothetical protein
MSSPGTVLVAASGETDDAGSFRVSRNQSFSGTVTLSTLPDPGDPDNPLVTGTMLDPSDPIDYDPNATTPSLGAGTPVDMDDIEMSGAPVGIYTLWIKGQAGSPYLTTKYTPFALQVGSVSRDFLLTAAVGEKTVASGAAATFDLKVRRVGGTFGSTVALSLEAGPDATWPAGIGAVSFSPASVTPAGGSGASSTLTINTGTMASGIHRLVVRASGTNSDGSKVTHLLPLTLNVGTAASGGNQEYVDIVGFAVMRVVAITSNYVSAYAITPVISDQADNQLRRGQVARLAPWN